MTIHADEMDRGLWFVKKDDVTIAVVNSLVEAERIIRILERLEDGERN